MDTSEKIIDKLKYIGLDLGNIPEFIKDFKELDYRPSKYNDEHLYKVYKYIDISNIQILLTPTNRLSYISEKYGKAVPLYAYLNPNTEENMERHTKFLSMVSNINIDKIEELEQEQALLNKKIPFKVKYPKDYLWQIYYSDYTDKYFMLVPTEDLEYTAFFYLLKKQIANAISGKKEKIFVPISHVDYSREYLNKSQITDIENYLWLFTKEWPLVYEVYNKDNVLSTNITGKTFIYDDIQSDYKIELKSKEESTKFYKMLKALFIMQTEMPHHFKIKTLIDNRGSLDFILNNKKVIYEILPSLIKEEYIKAEDQKFSFTEKKTKKEKELDTLQKQSVKLEKDFLEKERQITTFLECKKTFFGKVKYFLKYKKVSLTKKQEKAEKEQDVKVIRINKYADIKTNYTLEELIDLFKQVDKEENKVKNLESDINAIKQRITNLESKVKNASLYIEEIDKNKKSIFEFWKFTNKDKLSELPEGTQKEEHTQPLKKVFDFEFDFEDFAKQLDKTQREMLSKEELNSIFLATTTILEDINKISKNEEIVEERLEEIKKIILKENVISQTENFDIFGGIPYDNKLKILANKKHREKEREISNILEITKNTTLEEYKNYLSKIIKKLESAFSKIKLTIDMPIYKASADAITKNNFNKFDIKGSEALSCMVESKNNFYLYKINLKENTPIVAFTNIIYYDNYNKTLPLGMNVTEEILINNNLINLKLKSEEKINVVSYIDEKNPLSDIEIKTVNVEEYEVN